MFIYYDKVITIFNADFVFTDNRINHKYYRCSNYYQTKYIQISFPLIYYNPTLSFDVYSVTPTSSAAEYYLLGIASWQPTSFYNTSNPAEGYDFIGFYWGGSYALKSYNAWTTYSSNNAYLVPSDYAIDSGIVWGFNEMFKVGPSSHYPVSYDNITAEATIFKNTLTGAGNKTSFTCKYIHTYSTSSYSATVSLPPAISISPVTNQWSIVAVVNSLPY